jgi:hypothetical protein
MAVYTILLEQIDECYIDSNSYDVRTFHIMVEHMRICNELMRWIMTTEYVRTDKTNDLSRIALKYKALLNNMVAAQNLYIKLSITSSERDKTNLQNVVYSIRDTEKILLTELVHILK